MPNNNPSGQGFALGLLFPANFGNTLRQNSVPTTLSLQPGYIVEPGAQATGQLAQLHQAAVNQATGKALASPVIHFHFMGTPNT